jgi:hypothetical protein
MKSGEGDETHQDRIGDLIDVRAHWSLKMSTMTRAPAGQPLKVSPATTVKSYMVYAILCTVFLFLPTGIPAIYFAAKVKPAQRAGNVPEALEASRQAKLFCQISLLVGAVLWPIFIMTIVAANGDPSGSGLWYF